VTSLQIGGLGLNTIDVRAAAPTELARAIDTLVLAFSTDPFTRWVLPDPHDYLTRFPAILREFGAGAFENSTAYVTSDFRGASLWLPPGVHPDEDALGAVCRGCASGQHLADFLEVLDQMGRFDPGGPHWYLPMIGVDPTRQNGGLGSALLRHALARIDQEGALAYLESSNPANISLFERHGFEVIDEIRVGTSPPVSPMLRRPGVSI